MTKAIVFDHANLVLQDTNNYFSSSIVSGMIDFNLICEYGGISEFNRLN